MSGRPEMEWWLPDLPWLPRPERDVRSRCDSVDAMTEGRGAAIAALAGHALDLNQSARLSKSIGRAIAQKVDLSPLVPFRLAIVSSSTTGLLTSVLPAAAARHGIALSVVETGWGQVVQQALDPASAVNSAPLDAAIVAVDAEAIGLHEFSGDPETRVAAAIEYIETVRQGLRRNRNVTIILQTVIAPVGALFGSLESGVPGTPRALVAEFNRRLRAQAGSDVILDVASLATDVGTAIWFDPQHWHLHKLAVSPRMVPLYADHVGRMLGALRGRSRKCLVLDLDNTLWGGVVGDDGPAGIRLAEGDGVGEAFRAVQRMALALHRRGILLAICSKNDEALVRDVFRTHPDMLLREEHIAAFQVNWYDKATNLEEIARRLNFTLDAFVLLDDNPVERAQVRQALPTVAVPELPADPGRYRDALLSAGYFEAVTHTEEDVQRSRQYQLNAARDALRLQARDLSEFLVSLDMEMWVGPFDLAGRARITQLINRSNQYNLTARRYTESEVADIERDEGIIALQARLKDRFGDNGMISVVIARPTGGDNSEIDTWLMSCRVLGRRVEEAMLDALVEQLNRHGVKRLVGRYVPSGRNGLVKDHFERLGFSPDGQTDDGATCWALDLGSYIPRRPPICVKTLVRQNAGCDQPLEALPASGE